MPTDPTPPCPLCAGPHREADCPQRAPSPEAREVAERVDAAYRDNVSPTHASEIAATLIDRYAQRKVREALEAAEAAEAELRKWREHLRDALLQRRDATRNALRELVEATGRLAGSVLDRTPRCGRGRP